MSPKANPFFMNRFLSYAALILCLLSACLDAPLDRSCSPACSRGQVCNEATLSCARVNQKKFTGNISGRAFDAVSVNDRVFVSAQNERGDIIVSEFSGSSLKNSVVLAEFENNRTRKTVIDANDTTLVLAWREGEKYIVASREIDRSRTLWNFQIAQGSYRATDDFDILHVGDAFSLIFRDSSEGMFIIKSEVLEEEKWRLKPIEAKTQNIPLCENSDPGFDIDVLARSGALLVAFQDRGCGVLMLLRREKNIWVSSIVDDGRSGRTGKMRVGRHPSLSITEEGGIYIAYTDSENKLRLAREKDGLFERISVDDGKNTDTLSREVQNHVGAFSSIKSQDQNTKIAYYDGTEQRLLLAQSEGELWKISVVEEGDFIVGMNSKLLSFSNRDWVLTEKLQSAPVGDSGGPTLTSSLVVIEIRP